MKKRRAVKSSLVMVHTKRAVPIKSEAPDRVGTFTHLPLRVMTSGGQACVAAERLPNGFLVWQLKNVQFFRAVKRGIELGKREKIVL